MANLTQSAIDGLRAKGYSQFQIETIQKAASTGGAEGAKAAIAKIGTVVPTPKPVETSTATAPTQVITQTTPKKGNISPATITGLQSKGYSPQEIDSIKSAAETGGLSAAQAVIKGIGTKNAQEIVPPKQEKPQVSTATAVASMSGRKNVPLAEQTYTVPGTSLNLPKPRAVEIAKNLDSELTKNPSSFETREKYNAWSGYDQKTPAEKAVVDQFWNEKIQPTIEKKQAEQQTQTYESLEKPELIDQTTDQLAKTKQQALISQKTKELEDATDKFTKGVAALTANSAALRTLYGLKEDGSVDTENKNGLAFKVQSQLDNFKTERNKLLSETEAKQLRQVQATMRQSLARSGIRADTVSPELLVSLSGDLGITALKNISDARENTLNAILAEEKSANSQISAMQEKGVIDANQARVATETLRSQVEDLKNSINKQFTNDVLGVAEAAKTKKETESANVVNAVTKFGQTLGLSGTGLSAITSYLSGFANAQDAVNQMIKDLNNTKSDLYVKVGKAEADKIAAAKAAAELKKLAAEATLERAKKGSASGGTKFDATKQFNLGKLTGYAIETVDDLRQVYDDLKSKTDAASKAKLAQLNTYLEQNYITTEQ